jgi:hypothetical protein
MISPTGLSIQGSLEIGEAISYLDDGYCASDEDGDCKDHEWSGETEWVSQSSTGLWVDRDGDSWLEHHLCPVGTPVTEDAIVKMRREAKAYECCLALRTALGVTKKAGLPATEIEAAIAAVETSVM